MRAFLYAVISFVVLPVIVNASAVTLYDISVSSSSTRTRSESLEVFVSPTISEVGPIESGTQYVEQATRYKQLLHNPTTTIVVTDVIPYTLTINNYPSGYAQYGLLAAYSDDKVGTLYGEMHKSCDFNSKGKSGNCVLTYQFPQPTEKPENIPTDLLGISYTRTYSGIPYASTTFEVEAVPKATGASPNGATHNVPTIMVIALSAILWSWFLL